MRGTTALSRTTTAAVAVAVLCAASALTAVAAPSVSGEVAGNSAAARTAVDALRTPWVTTLAADGYTAPTPMVLTAAVGSNVTGVIGTTAAGTTVSVERSRYSASTTAPTFVAASTNPGTAACTNSGLSLQGNAPRPASLVGNAACSNGNGTVYTESGGTGEATTRDALTFTFSRPVWGFGAWFGDLETRTDGQGVPAIVRLLDTGGAVVEQFQVAPDVTQSACSSAANGCGNNTTRWVGFTGRLASSMVVIVGDEDATGTALDEGIGFIGANPVDATPELGLAIGTTPIGPVTAGTVVNVPATVSDPGDVPVSSLTGVTCPSTTIAAGATLACTVPHTVTQTEINAGSFTQAATVSGDWTGRPVSASDTEVVPLVQAPAFTVALSAAPTSFDSVGAVITYTATVTNTGNQTRAPDGVTVPGVTLVCSPAGALAPGASSTCTGTLTTTTGADVVRAATVNWGANSATSQPVTVAWVARRGFTVTLAADPTSFDTIGDVITYTATVTNIGNETSAPDAVTIPGVTLLCSPAGALAPGASSTCTGTLTTTTGADVVRAATVSWGPSSATSQPVTVAWVARRGFTVTLAADPTSFDTIGDVITYTATVTNTGNETECPGCRHRSGRDPRVQPGRRARPGSSSTCTGTLTTTTGADVVRAATVNWGANSATQPTRSPSRGWPAEASPSPWQPTPPASTPSVTSSPTPPPSPTPATRRVPRMPSPFRA